MDETSLSFGNSELSADIRESLLAVADTMRLARDDWCLIGGAGFLLHDLQQEKLSDIDIVLSVADADLIAERLRLQPQVKSPHPSFRSKRFLVWEEPPVPVEFMAGFDVFHDGRWVNITAKNCLAVSLDGHALRVPQFEDFAAICHLFGRPKDLQRLEQLSAVRETE